ncbi:MAG: hypothetical protein ACJAW3_001186 [Lentimonas sp.]
MFQAPSTSFHQLELLINLELGAKMTKKTPLNLPTELYQNYQSIFDSIAQTENNLLYFLDHFDQLPKERKIKLLNKLKSFEGNFHSICKYFNISSENRSAIKAGNTQFLCTQEGEKLVIRITK